jgi:hypothetical protein
MLCSFIRIRRDRGWFIRLPCRPVHAGFALRLEATGQTASTAVSVLLLRWSAMPWSPLGLGAKRTPCSIASKKDMFRRPIMFFIYPRLPLDGGTTSFLPVRVSNPFAPKRMLISGALATTFRGVRPWESRNSPHSQRTGMEITCCCLGENVRLTKCGVSLRATN